MCGGLEVRGSQGDLERKELAGGSPSSPMLFLSLGDSKITNMRSRLFHLPWCHFLRSRASGLSYTCGRKIGKGGLHGPAGECQEEGGTSEPGASPDSFHPPLLQPPGCQEPTENPDRAVMIGLLSFLHFLFLKIHSLAHGG